MSQLQVFDKLKADITLFVQPTFGLAVTDNDSMNEAKMTGKQVKHYLKLIEEKRKELTAPLLEEQRHINSIADSLKEPLNKSEAHLKNQLLKWEIKLADLRRKEQERIEAERKSKEAELLKERAEAQKKLEEEKKLAQEFGLADEQEERRLDIIAKEEADRKEAESQKELRAKEKAAEAMKVGGVAKIWKFKLDDLSKVPFEFLTLDENKVKEFMRSAVKEKKNPELSGITFFQDQTMRL